MTGRNAESVVKPIDFLYSDGILVMASIQHSTEHQHFLKCH